MYFIMSRNIELFTSDKHFLYVNKAVIKRKDLSCTIEAPKKLKYFMADYN